jgi:hypothetical protein
MERLVADQLVQSTAKREQDWNSFHRICSTIANETGPMSGVARELQDIGSGLKAIRGEAEAFLAK